MLTSQSHKVSQLLMRRLLCFKALCHGGQLISRAYTRLLRLCLLGIRLFILKGEK